jgi:hypothetical protein
MRRIKHAEVKRLALCKRGKNGLQTLYKSDGTAEFVTLTKGDDKGQLLSVMWPKGLADTDGDFADTQAALESMSSSLIANGGQLDIEHDGKVLSSEAARITEVFTVQPSDPRFEGWKDYDGNVADVSGGIAVAIQIDDPDLRASYRNGDWDGVSLFGPAAVEQVDIVAASQRVAARMGGSMQENQMNQAELQAALDAQKAEMISLVKSTIEAALVTKAETTEEVAEVVEAKAEAKPTFTGDVNDPQALADYETSLRGYELRKAIESGDMSADDIADMRKSMVEGGPSVSDLNEAGIKAEDSDSKDVRDLQVKLFKARKGTNVPTRNVSATDEVDELAKSAEAEGLEIAKLMNAQLGNSPDAGGMRVIG